MDSLHKIAIVGSRDWPDLVRVSNYVRQLAAYYKTNGIIRLMIVSGGARGVDTVAVETAKSIDVPTKEFKPVASIINSEGFAAAAFARNQTIVDFCDSLVAFWTCTKKSSGTIDVMNRADKAKKLDVLFMMRSTLKR